MAKKTNRREFVQVAGLAASGLMATAGPIAAAVPVSQARPAPRTMGARFRALLNGPEPLICPGAYDVLTARLVELHGFKGTFIGSSVVNQAMLGLPDQAIVTVSEIIDYDGIIASNVDIPVLADVDDFGTTPLNVYRFAKVAERRGIGCAAFDDRMPINRARVCGSGCPPQGSDDRQYSCRGRRAYGYGSYRALSCSDSEQFLRRDA